jgi:polar amino acid transport system permease protein
MSLNGSILSSYLSIYLSAAWMTLQIAGLGILLSALVGLAASMFSYYRVPVLRQITAVYIEISRNTPLLVQLFFLYFGLPKIGIRLSGFACAVIGTAFLGGSYMAESFRSGLEAVDQSQIESAESLGMSRLQIMWHVVFPQALALSVPGLFANIIFLIKETSVVSAIALPDLMYAAKDLIGNDYNTGEALFLLVAAYLCILLPISLFARFTERRLRYAGFGN